MKRLISRLVISTLAVLFAPSRGALSHAAAGQQQQEQQPTTQCGLCYSLDTTTGKRSVIPLESTEVVLDVKPGLMSAEVIQTFSNRTETALEAIYAYPLPDEATLTEFELHYKDRVVRSVVHEKQQARTSYETARLAGQKTALLEQRDASLFSTSVANFLPGETVKVMIRFIQPLSLTATALDVRFPMVTGEKYFPADATPGTEGNAAPNPTRISSAMAEKHVYAFDVEVAGLPVRAIESPSHRVRVEQAGTDRFLVALADEITIPDRDFVLRVELEPQKIIRPTLVMQRTATGDYGLLTVFPPMEGRQSTAQYRPRDVLFLIDRSGSMQGPRFKFAKLGLETCLKALSPDDRFQIVPFDTTFAFYQRSWLRADPGSVGDAVGFVRNLAIGSGTELQPALDAALAAFESGERDKVLILLTDGDVGNERDLLKLVERKCGKVRLFPLGIGDAPNAALLKKAARLAHGQARFIGDNAAIERELIDLFATLEAPALRDVRVSLLDSDGRSIERSAFPEKIPDVFLGRPVQVAFRTTAGAPASALVEATDENGPIVSHVPVAATSLRGRGLETEFGRRSYAELDAMWRRAESESERAPIREEMLATALQFQLVTELTSRVAVDETVSRTADASLESHVVGQYTPADQRPSSIASAPQPPTVVTTDANGEQLVILSPFCLTSESDTAYAATSTLGGTRVRTPLRDVASAITVITDTLIRDVAPLRPEDVLSYTMESQDESVGAPSGGDTVLLDGLPIATVVDPATVNRITMQSSGPSWRDISQYRAGGATRSTLTTRIGDEGVAAMSFDSSSQVGGDGTLPARLVFSWTNLGRDQWSAFLDAKKSLGADALRGNLQWRDLDGYGQMLLARATFEHKFGSSMVFETTLARHELKRVDAEQFRLDSTTARYDGLGFFNLDLLTAETRRLSDTIAQVQFGGSDRGGEITHVWKARAQFHRQESAWGVPVGDARATARRDNGALDLDYRIGIAGDRLGIAAHLGAVEHRTPGGAISRAGTQNAALGVNVEVVRDFSLYANWTRDEILPWMPTGELRLIDGAFALLAPEIEKRDGEQLGVKIDTAHARISGVVALFHERVSGRAFRNWSWERDNAASGAVALTSETLRLPLSYGVWNDFEREGWMGSLDFNPTRSLTGIASWYCDWKNAGPYRGATRRASIATRYSFRSGLLNGFTAGLGVSVRNDTVFDDGFTLPGGVRCDAMVGYSTRLIGEHETAVQLNLANIAGRSWQPTRFSNDRGAQVLLSITQHF